MLGVSWRPADNSHRERETDCDDNGVSCLFFLSFQRLLGVTRVVFSAVEFLSHVKNSKLRSTQVNALRVRANETL